MSDLIYRGSENPKNTETETDKAREHDLTYRGSTYDPAKNDRKKPKTDKVSDLTYRGNKAA